MIGGPEPAYETMTPVFDAVATGPTATTGWASPARATT